MSGWHQDALCAQVGAVLFFNPDTEAGEPVGSHHFREAKEVCRRCPVQTECLEDALAWEGDIGSSGRTGIFGGLGPTERARIAAQRSQDAA